MKTEPRITVENNRFSCRIHACKNGQSQKTNIPNKAKNLCTVYVWIEGRMQNCFKQEAQLPQRNRATHMLVNSCCFTRYGSQKGFKQQKFKSSGSFKGIGNGAIR